ncbi:MAG TPA: hypothetical protein VKR58_06185 [Aquella sp.]|nr:hypothetical protein [Aquella sp.]
MSTEVYREKLVKAKKDYRCEGCWFGPKSIKAGDLYYDTFCVFDSEARGYKLCVPCRDYLNSDSPAVKDMCIDGWIPGDLLEGRKEEGLV